MRRVLLLIAVMAMAGCECGPGVTCNTNSDCPSWGRCEKLGEAKGVCVLLPLTAVDAGSDAGVDAGAPFASLDPLTLEITHAGCGLGTDGTVIVTNTGTAPLTVSASTGTSPTFNVAPSGGSVPAGQSLTFTVT